MRAVEIVVGAWVVVGTVVLVLRDTIPMVRLWRRFGWKRGNRFHDWLYRQAADGEQDWSAAMRWIRRHTPR